MTLCLYVPSVYLSCSGSLTQCFSKNQVFVSVQALRDAQHAFSHSMFFLLFPLLTSQLFPALLYFSSMLS